MGAMEVKIDIDKSLIKDDCLIILTVVKGEIVKLSIEKEINIELGESCGVETNGYKGANLG